MLIAPFSVGFAVWYTLDLPHFNILFFIFQNVIVGLYIIIQYLRIYRFFL